MVYLIYLHRNKINGKVYIGQTSKTLDERCRNGWGYTKSSYFFLQYRNMVGRILSILYQKKIYQVKKLIIEKSIEFKPFSQIIEIKNII